MRKAAKGNIRITLITGLALYMASSTIGWANGKPAAEDKGYKLPAQNRAAHARGPKIVEKLADRLAKVAQKHGISEEEFIAWVNSDNSVHMDEAENLYHVCEGLVIDEIPGVDADSSSFTSNSGVDAFNLSSFPDSPLTIHLDFDGHVTSGTIWNNYTGGSDIVTPPYDVDGNLSTFSATELSNIIEIWKRVAEDFAPWQVNVTTVDPGAEALKKSSSTDQEYGVRIAIGGSSTDWYGSSAGGVAYLNSFDWNTDCPAYIFENQLGNGTIKYTSEAISHEAGHTFGLRHDGTSSVAYYSGHGDWAPIMGVGYYEPISQWSKGEYADANNTEDDLAKISAYLPLRTDAAGDDIQTQATLGQEPVIQIIEVGTDFDIYAFQTDGGQVDLSAEAVSDGNLDILMALYDGMGSLVSSSDPSVSRSASLSLYLNPGTYYVSVEGTSPGDPSTAYTDYASIGQYRISGTFATSENTAPVAVASATTPVEGRGPLSITFSASESYDPDGSIITYDWAFGDGSSDSSVNPTHLYTEAGVYTATLVVVDDKGASASDSMQIIVTEPLPPIADASKSSPTSGTAPLVVSLDGRASSDPDGTITSYSWLASNGATAYGSLSSLTFNEPGSYTVSLQVIDDEGLEDIDTITITVNEPAPADVLFVDSISMRISGNARKGYVAEAKVIIIDAKGKAVTGAMVYGQFSGAVTGSASAETGRKGDASLESVKFNNSGDVFFEVTDVVLDGFEYIP